MQYRAIIKNWIILTNRSYNNYYIEFLVYKEDEMNNLKVFACNSAEDFAQKVCDELKIELR